MPILTSRPSAQIPLGFLLGALALAPQPEALASSPEGRQTDTVSRCESESSRGRILARILEFGAGDRCRILEFGAGDRCRILEFGAGDRCRILEFGAGESGRILEFGAGDREEAGGAQAWGIDGWVERLLGWLGA